MRLEQLAITVRPRSGWQAMDLGFQIARQWWRPIWAAWFAVYLPVALLLNLLCYLMLEDALWLAGLLLWWLKPAFDRVVMRVVSQAVFGSPPTLRETLRGARAWLTPGIVGALLWRRLDFARSMMVPVMQLEGQRGRDARARRKVLGKRMRGYAVWLTVVCAHFEWVVLYALGLLHLLLAPAGVEADFDWRAFLQSMAAAWAWSDALLYALAVSIIEPFYVCAGFSLYLNRRATLEGWDIELALRKLGERLRRMSGAAALALVLSFAAFQPNPSFAAPTPKEAAAEVLKAPEFQAYKEGKRWAYRGEREEKQARSKDSFLWLKNLMLFFSEIAQGVAWIGAGVLIALLVYAAMRWRGGQSERVERYVPPAALFGMDVRPETLPDDVAGAAAQLARDGRVREALSLLYRGALSNLIHRHRVRLHAGDTEGDCLRRAEAQLEQPTHHFFTRLVVAWRQTAYGRSAALADEVQALCRDWALHFTARGDAT